MNKYIYLGAAKVTYSSAHFITNTKIKAALFIH